MSEVSAAIGTVQLSHLDSWVGRRRLPRFTTKHLLTISLYSQKLDKEAAAWHQYCLSTESPDELVAHLDQHGIDTRRYYVANAIVKMSLQNTLNINKFFQ